MIVDTYTAGTPCWVDLGTKDIEAAKKFYTAMFGWEMRTDPEADGYTLAVIGDKHVAAISPLMRDQQPTAWCTFISVADADATAARIEAHGGTIMQQPMQVLDAGIMGVATDCCGAVFMIWQPLNQQGAQRVDENNAWSWSQLFTSNTTRAAAFYSAVFDWVAKEDDSIADLTMLMLNGNPVGSMMQITPEMGSMPSYWGVSFNVENAQKAADVATANGGTVMRAPENLGPITRTVIKDPTGGIFLATQV